MNSIKSGIALDYPLFSSSVDSAIDVSLQETSGSEFSMFSNYSLASGSELVFYW